MSNKLLSFKAFLTEARDVVDLRHRDFRNTPGVDPGVNIDKYINPKSGFYWWYYNNTLILSSHETPGISSALAYAQLHNEVPGELSKSGRIANPQVYMAWNQLGGLVDLDKKIITISKEYAENGMRQRTVSHTKEFKQAVQSLMKYGVSEDFNIKGAPQHIPKTVKDVLTLDDQLSVLLDVNKPSIMYHGTSQYRWNFIEKRGLLPRALDSNRKAADDVYNDLIPNYSEKNVYLTTTKNTAEFYAKRQANKDISSPVILIIDIPDKSLLIPDDRFVNKQNKEYSFLDFKKSLYALGEFAYRGPILPKFIRKIN